jgi:hypothetical protein
MKEHFQKVAHLETIKVIKDKITPKVVDYILTTPIYQPPEIQMPLMDYILAVYDNSIIDWKLYKKVYSQRIGDYLIGLPIPIIKTVGSSHIPVTARKIFGEIIPAEKVERGEK